MAVASALFDMDGPPSQPQPQPREQTAGATAEAGPGPGRARVLLSLSYRQPIWPGSPTEALAGNVYLAPGPTGRWDAEAAIESARAWFAHWCPGMPLAGMAADRAVNDDDDGGDEDNNNNEVEEHGATNPSAPAADAAVAAQAEAQRAHDGAET
jgi:hypothetical protein